MKCWYCEKETMTLAPELGEGWFRCSKCGATWVEPLRYKLEKRKAKK